MAKPTNNPTGQGMGRRKETAAGQQVNPRQPLRDTSNFGGSLNARNAVDRNEGNPEAQPGTSRNDGALTRTYSAAFSDNQHWAQDASTSEELDENMQRRVKQRTIMPSTGTNQTQNSILDDTSALQSDCNEIMTRTEPASLNEENERITEKAEVSYNEENQRITEQAEVGCNEENQRVTEKAEVGCNEENQRITEQAEVGCNEENERVTDQAEVGCNEENERVTDQAEVGCNEENERVTDQAEVGCNEENERVTDQAEVGCNEENERVTEQAEVRYTEENQHITDQAEVSCNEENEHLTEQAEVGYNKEKQSITEQAEVGYNEEKQSITEQAEEEPMRNTDADNIIQVWDYAEEFYNVLLEKEMQGSADPNYMSAQSYINANTRATLIDWLIEVHHRFSLRPQTLFLTVNIIDRYLSKRRILKRNLQLVGVTAMIVACKFEEILIPMVSDFMAICDDAYSGEQVLEMEKLILLVLQFNLTVPTPLLFIHMFLNVADSDRELTSTALFLMELCLVEYSAVSYRPSMLAAAALYTARCILQRQPFWNSTLECQTNYTESALGACAKMIAVIHAQARKSQFKAVFDKYKTPDFCCAAMLEPAQFLLPNT